MATRFDDSSAFTDRYHIEREVGSGGMARVFLAEDLKHERQVGRNQLYGIVPAPLGAAYNWLGRYQRFWRASLAQLKRHVEGQGC